MRTARIVSGALLILWLAGCAVMPWEAPWWPFAGAQSKLQGKWKNKPGMVWTIRADGTFDLDLNHDGAPDISGTCYARGRKITVRATSGQLPPGCETPAVYRYKLRKDKLSFSVVQDTCTERLILFSKSWRRAE